MRTIIPNFKGVPFYNAFIRSWSRRGLRPPGNITNAEDVIYLRSAVIKPGFIFSRRRNVRIFWRALLLFSLCAVFVGAGWAQNVETFSAGSGANSAGPGGEYDASVCDDPQIPILAAQQKATPYHDPNWNTPGDSLREALQILAQEYNNNNIDSAGACAHAPGVVFMVPT